MSRLLKIALTLGVLLISALSVAAQSTATPQPTPTIGNNYFQTGNGTPQALPTAFPTLSLPTPTFIPYGQPPPSFPQIYNPSETASSPIGLVLNGEHIKTLVWNMVMYSVQMWNYYYNVMDGGAHEAIDAAQGVGLVAVVLVIMTNLYGEFRPRIHAGIKDARTQANEWANRPPDWTQPPSPPSNGNTP